MDSLETRSVRLRTGFAVGRSIAINPAMVMVVLLIFLDPWHTFLSGIVGLPTYSLTVLLTLIIIAFQFAKGSGDFSVFSEKYFYVYILIAISLMAIVFVRFSHVAGAEKIFGSVVFPFGVGVLIALVKDKNNLGYYLGVALLFKLVLLVPLAHDYFQAYPKRPTLNGEAIYLLFGVGLDAIVGMLIAAASTTHSKIRLIVILLLPVAAFNLVGMNSRGLIVSSLFIGMMAACLGKVQHRYTAMAFLCYVASVFAAFHLLPERAAHLDSMLGTLLSYLGDGSYQGPIDDSTAIRMNDLWQVLQLGSIDALGHNLTKDDAYLLGIHFFPLVVGYGAGYFGLALFVIIWGVVAFRTLKLIACSYATIKFTGLFGLATVLQIGYFGVLFNSQVVFLVFGFFLALPSLNYDFVYPRDGLTYGDASKEQTSLFGVSTNQWSAESYQPDSGRLPG